MLPFRSASFFPLKAKGEMKLVVVLSVPRLHDASAVYVNMHADGFG